MKLLQSYFPVPYKSYENGPSELRFLGAGMVLPLNFVKDKDGNMSQIVEDTDYGRVFKKIATPAK